MMKTTFVGILLLLCTIASKAQVYTFPPDVDKEIKQYVASAIKKSPDRKFYLELSTLWWKKENEATYSVGIGEYSDDERPIEAVSDIIKQSSRYYIYGDTKIPIFFDYDSFLIAYGTDKKGRPIRKALLLHNFTIHFNKNGQLISK